MRKAELNCFEIIFVFLHGFVFRNLFCFVMQSFEQIYRTHFGYISYYSFHLVFDSWNFVWKFSQDTFISIEIKYILVSLVELRHFTYCWFECCILTTHDKMISLSFLILLPVQQYFASFNGKSHSLVHWKTLASVTMCLIFSQWQAKKTVYIFIIDHGVLTFLLILWKWCLIHFA